MKEREQTFTIKDLSRYSSVKVTTLRAWESRYGYLKPRRNSRNSRVYTLEEFCLGLKIAAIVQTGVKISSICRIGARELTLRFNDLTASSNGETLKASLYIFYYTRSIDAFEKVIDDLITREGTEVTVKNYIFRFLQVTRLLWRRTNDNSDRLFISYLQNRFIRCFSSSQQDIGKSTLIFSAGNPGSELFYHYAVLQFKLMGWKVYCAGHYVPGDEVEDLISLCRPNLVFVLLSKKDADKNHPFLLHYAKLPTRPAIFIANRFLKEKKMIAPAIHSGGYEADLTFIEQLCDPR